MTTPTNAVHPMQPVVVSSTGTHRFKANAIVNWMVDRIGLTEIFSEHCDRPGFADDYQQLLQLVGYSVSGHPRLPEHIRNAAERASEAIADGETPTYPTTAELAEAKREHALDTLETIRQLAGQLVSDFGASP